MDSINQILYAIDSINSNELIAEGTTISVYEQWIDKMTFLMEHAENFEDLDFVQEAKSVGTGVTSSKGDSLIRRIWDFIRKVVHAVINKISDIATKIKIHNYEYVEIPMEYNDIKADVDDISGIWDGIAGLLSHEDTSDIENYDYSKDAAETKKLLDKVNNLRILNVKSNNKRYGVKPEVFMTMRDKLRYLNQQLNDVSKRTDAFIKATENTDAFKNKSYEQYCRATQQLFAKMHEASTKLFASFKFKNATKTDAEVKIVKKLQEVDNDLNQLREIVKESVEYDIDDGEWIDETEKPFDDYLKKHKYDPDTNTIEINGKRVNFGKKLSTKEKNRANRFLRENDYDPKTETIKTDIKLPSGRNHRIKFNMNDYKAGTDTDAFFRPPTYDYSDRNDDAYDAYSPTIHMSPKQVSKKPRTSNQTYKHEEGHYNQYNNYYDNDDNDDDDPFKPRKETKENIEDFMSKNLDVSDVDSHYNSSELDADLYGYQHNPYASKTKGNKSQMNYAKRDVTKEGEKEKKKFIETAEADAKNKKKSLEEKIAIDTKYDIEKYEADLKIAKEFFKIHQDTLVMLQNLNKSYGYKSDDGLDIKTSIYESLKRIEELENRIKTLKNTPIKDSEKYRAAVAKIATEKNAFIKDMIDQIDNSVNACKTEIHLRNKFLNRNKEEAASQARKLEGRQGKHKGKHK